jgi:excisionase family DNA binding protein
MLKKNPMQSKLLTIRQAAEILNVHVETLRRWDKTGKFKAIKVSDRGDRRYKQEDIESFINQRKK